MPRGRVKVKEDKEPKIYCSACGKEKLLRYFYKSNSLRYDNDDYKGRCSWCTDCLKKKAYLSNGMLDKQAFMKILKEDLDLPFFNDLYLKALDDKRETIGYYITLLNISNRGKKLLWEHGEKEEDVNKVKTINNNGLVYKDEMKELIDKWGNEWNQEELLLLEQTYKELGADKNMKYNASKQYLKLATMNYVRSYTAMKNGQVQDAEKYTKLFNETMKMGEFNPSALAKNSNLEKLGSFCDFSLMVEECVDVMDLQRILPEYMQQPRDLADKVIWYVVNYMQDSLGHKMSSYEDIYRFYTKMEEDYFGIPSNKIPRSSTVNDILNINDDEDESEQ